MIAFVVLYLCEKVAQLQDVPYGVTRTKIADLPDPSQGESGQRLCMHVFPNTLFMYAQSGCMATRVGGSD